MSNLIIAIILVAIAFFILGFCIGRLYPAKPIMFDDILESMMLLPLNARKNAIKSLEEQCKK